MAKRPIRGDRGGTIIGYEEDRPAARGDRGGTVLGGTTSLLAPQIAAEMPVARTEQMRLREQPMAAAATLAGISYGENEYGQLSRNRFRGTKLRSAARTLLG